MRCTSPRTVGFRADGKTLSWSPRHHSKEFATFQLPCGQCIECRLDYARQWAIRCVHEAQVHEENSFVTLTYSDENLVSQKLIYKDFQLFMKRLRKTQDSPIGVFVTGEYGEKTKRPHWHAILFNYRPRDCKPAYKNHRGDQVFHSENLTKLWGKGHAELGSVTIESAGYVARYAAKKLGHGPDHEKNFEPISKKSNKHAIGKKWLEKFWPDIFNWGYTILLDGTKTGVPRYYEKWLQKNQPERWLKYVTETKTERASRAIARATKEAASESAINARRALRGPGTRPQVSREEVRRKISKEKFKQLSTHTKL